VVLEKNHGRDHGRSRLPRRQLEEAAAAARIYDNFTALFGK
jgi:hypothetical protein